MSILSAIRSGPPVLKKYRYKLLLAIAITWTVIDSAYMSLKYYVFGGENDYHFFEYTHVNTLILREVLVFLTSCAIGYLLVFRQQRMHRRVPLWANFLINTLFLLLISFVFNLLFHFFYSVFISGLSVSTAIYQFFHDAFYTYWLVQKIPHWLGMLLDIDFLRDPTGIRTCRKIFARRVQGHLAWKISESNNRKKDRNVS